MFRYDIYVEDDLCNDKSKQKNVLYTNTTKLNCFINMKLNFKEILLNYRDEVWFSDFDFYSWFSDFSQLPTLIGIKIHSQFHSEISVDFQLCILYHQ